MARITNGLHWKISRKHAEKVPGHSGQRWGLDYLLGSSAVVLREYIYFKKNVLKSQIVLKKSRTRSCWTDCIYISTGTIPASPYSKFFLYLPTLGEMERKRSNPQFLVLPESGEEIFLIVVAKKNITWVLLVCNLHKYARTQTDTTIVTFC